MRYLLAIRRHIELSSTTRIRPFGLLSSVLSSDEVTSIVSISIGLLVVLKMLILIHT